jgi:flagellar biosynthesis anti-sigma factor FlgM
MTIQPLTGKQNNLVSPSKSTPNEKLQNTNVQTIPKENDSVDITTVAKKITEAFESSKTTPAIDEKHVREVKKAIMEGTYPINAEEIARKMIEMEREPNINSR